MYAYHMLVVMHINSVLQCNKNMKYLACINVTHAVSSNLNLQYLQILNVWACKNHLVNGNKTATEYQVLLKISTGRTKILKVGEGDQLEMRKLIFF